jgi:hypothetical protein
MPAQHAEVRDQVLSLLTRLIEVEQERLFCEHELYRIREAAPDPEALWIVHSLEQVRLLPPVLTQLAKRFGFKVPDPDHVASEPQPTEPATAWGQNVQD